MAKKMRATNPAAMSRNWAGAKETRPISCPEHQGDDQEGNEHQEDRTPPERADEETTERGPHGRSDGGDERGETHHGSHPFVGNLLQHDVEHQRQRDARPDALQDASADQEREVRGGRAHDRPGQEGEHGREEERPGAEPAVQERGDRHDRGEHQQIPGRDPLHGRGVHPELAHERREGDVHRGLHDHPGERHDAHRDDGDDEACIETSFKP